MSQSKIFIIILFWLNSVNDHFLCSSAIGSTLLVTSYLWQHLLPRAGGSTEYSLTRNSRKQWGGLILASYSSILTVSAAFSSLMRYHFEFSYRGTNSQTEFLSLVCCYWLFQWLLSSLFGQSLTIYVTFYIHHKMM